MGRRGQMLRELTDRAVDVLQRSWDVAVERQWRSQSNLRELIQPPPSPAFSATTVIRWPRAYDWHSTSKWVEGLRSALARRVRLEWADLPQTWERVVTFELELGGERHLCAIDYADSSELHPELARRCLVYFKLQHRRGGYGLPSVVPGGYITGNHEVYSYLRPVRALRDQRQFSWDVNARFGLRFAADLRTVAVQQLSAARDLRFHGGAGRLVRYSRHLREIAQSRVCVDLPGNGDFCFRLVDYFAVGACVVARRHRNNLPVELVDDFHVVWVKDDLSDLVEQVRALVHDEERRERIALNARRYFDAHLHKEALADWYVDCWTRAVAAQPRQRVPNVLRRPTARTEALSLSPTL